MGDKLRQNEAILSPLAAARRVLVIRLTDLPSDQAKCLAELECQDVETRPWVTGPALSIPPAVALGVLVRRPAPTDRAGTMLAAGPSSATQGAFVFVFAWFWQDSLYIAVCTVSCSIVTTVGRAALVRLSRCKERRQVRRL